MPLIKYCRREHNIGEGCDSLRVGTLIDYHDTDNQEINDKGEGLLRLHYDVPEGSLVSKRWVAAVTQFIGFDGIETPRFRFSTGFSEELALGIEEGDKVRIKKMSGFVNLVSKNRLIYCASDQEHIKFTQYDSMYRVDDKNVQIFAKTIADLLWSQLRMNNLDFVASGIEFGNINNGFNVVPTIRKVTYLDYGRNFPIDSEEQFPLKWLFDTQNEMAFIKPSEFKEESEVRICFDVFTKYGHPVEIEKGFVDLDLNVIKSLTSVS